MKAGISNIWLLGMVAIFIFIFSCYVTISVNYTKSFKMKNEMLSIIERGKGITGLNGAGSLANWARAGKNGKSFTGANITVDVGSFRTMNLYLLGNAYSATGKCPDGEEENAVGKDCWYGVVSMVDNTYEKADPKKEYFYCFSKFALPTNNSNPTSRFNKYYYKIRVFYRMDFPVLSDFLSVNVDGKTHEINDAQDITTLPACSV